MIRLSLNYIIIFLSWHKTHEKQLKSILYQGAALFKYQFHAACNNANMQEVERNLLKYQKFKFLSSNYFFELVNCTVINCTMEGCLILLI